MPTEPIHFTTNIVGALAQTGPKYKPKGVCRAYQVNDTPFVFGLFEGKEGDYLVLLQDGTVRGEEKEFFESHFEPVKPRIRKKGAKHGRTENDHH